MNISLLIHKVNGVRSNIMCNNALNTNFKIQNKLIAKSHNHNYWMHTSSKHSIHGGLHAYMNHSMSQVVTMV